MDEFSSEKEQIEAIRQWWKENGPFIVGGLILALGLIGGWKYWTNYQLRQAETASAHYEQLIRAVNDNDRSGATTVANRLRTEFAATPYANQAALVMAQYHLNAGEPDLAAEQLRQVMTDAKDDQLKLVARLRLARILVYQDRAQDAVTTLDAVEPGRFAARYHEVRGDAYVALGQNDDARREYQSALDKFEPGLFDRRLVEMKLNDLAAPDRRDQPEA